MDEKEKTQRQAVVNEALSWLKTPYHHMGRVKGVGVDCGMLILETFERCGLVPHIAIPYYPPDWALHRSEEQYLGWIMKYSKMVDREPLPGDVIMHRFGRCVSHGGIVIVWPQIVHAYITDGVVLADARQLAARQAGIYSYWG